MKSPIAKSVLNKWADIILNNSLHGTKPNDVIMVKGEAISWPLIAVLQEKILKAGAMADVFIVPPDNENGRVYGAAVAKYAKPESLVLPEWQKMRYRGMTKYIEILGMETPEAMRDLNPVAMRKIMRLYGELKDIRFKVPFVITMFPTPAHAKTEGMTFRMYKNTVCRASVQSPDVLKALSKNLAAKLRPVKLITMITREPGKPRDYRLELNISKSIVLQDIGGKYTNIPCGEVYTSPDANSVEGEVFCDLPYRFQGPQIMQGIYLKFRRGTVVDYRAKHGRKLLAQILTSDPGAKRIGEVAFGFNQALKKVLLRPLFSEKLAGTMHIALGKGFSIAHVHAPETASGQKRYMKLLKAGIANNSAQHVDLVVSFRKGGAGRAVFLDDKELRLSSGNWDPE